MAAVVVGFATAATGRADGERHRCHDQAHRRASAAHRPQTPPSPSSGPPLLSESPSPPPFCGMPLDAAGRFGAGVDVAAGVRAGVAAGVGAGVAAGVGAGDDEAPRADFACGLETCLPAGETTNQRPPNAVKPSPFVAPAFLSMMNV